jgi:hypothetical protein
MDSGEQGMEAAEPSRRGCARRAARTRRREIKRVHGQEPSPELEGVHRSGSSRELEQLAGACRGARASSPSPVPTPPRAHHPLLPR